MKAYIVRNKVSCIICGVLIVLSSYTIIINFNHARYLNKTVNISELDTDLKINNEYVIIGVKNIYVLLSIKYMEIVQYFILPNIKNIISIFKYDFDNMVLFVAKAADEENIFYQYKFDEEDKILKEISHFENSVEKYGDYRFNFLNNSMIISFYYYYSTSTNKKFELFA